MNLVVSLCLLKDHRAFDLEMKEGKKCSNYAIWSTARVRCDLISRCHYFLSSKCPQTIVIHTCCDGNFEHGKFEWSGAVKKGDIVRQTKIFMETY